MELDKPLNQSLQSGLEKINYMSSIRPSKNYCGILEVNLKKKHVLKGQNGGFTVLLKFRWFCICLKFEQKLVPNNVGDFTLQIKIKFIYFLIKIKYKKIKFDLKQLCWTFDL